MKVSTDSIHIKELFSDLIQKQNLFYKELDQLSKSASRADTNQRRSHFKNSANSLSREIISFYSKCKEQTNNVELFNSIAIYQRQCQSITKEIFYLDQSFMTNFQSQEVLAKLNQTCNRQKSRLKSQSLKISNILNSINEIE